MYIYMYVSIYVYIMCVYMVKEYQNFEIETTIQLKNWKGEKIIWRGRTYDSMVEAMPLEDV